MSKQTKMSPPDILHILDETARSFVFPMLDNGYVYLAASRLSIFSDCDRWALVFEIFGYSPRAGLPDLCVTAIGNSLRNRKEHSDFNTRDAFENYLKTNPFNEQQFYYPISNEDWIDPADCEMVANNSVLCLRDKQIPVPETDSYLNAGIPLSGEQPHISELCRAIASHHRNDVLAIESERLFNVPEGLPCIMTLDDWHHPDLVVGQLPSETEAFGQLAVVLATGDPAHYDNSEGPNTHWKNWHDGGSL